jgi:hypothetical protein
MRKRWWNTCMHACIHAYSYIAVCVCIDALSPKASVYTIITFCLSSAKRDFNEAGNRSQSTYLFVYVKCTFYPVEMLASKGKPLCDVELKKREATSSVCACCRTFVCTHRCTYLEKNLHVVYGKRGLDTQPLFQSMHKLSWIHKKKFHTCRKALHHQHARRFPTLLACIPARTSACWDERTCSLDACIKDGLYRNHTHTHTHTQMNLNA